MVDLNANILGKVECLEADYNLAIDAVEYAFKKGVKEMVVATKCGVQDVAVSIEKMEIRLSILKNKLEKNNIDVKLYLAESIKLSESNIKDCLNGKFGSINKSKYMLIDLDETMTNQQVDMVFELTLIGIVPIIVHPERCKEIIEKISRIEKLKDLGCLFELDINSLTGLYGKEIKRIAKQLLRAKVYNFVASELNGQLTRNTRYSYSGLSKSQKDTFKGNGLKVLRDEDIINHIGTTKVKKKLFAV
ncbi:hypothetical protein H7E67_14580 [Clostridium gasigenes]|uniref:CpsB/CapC family capsule biosynthesis tyrosine phosphatase n=1 Tax=Clostridium gasigenes TaxID=94869 RepID=UPI00162A67B0|nr:CpsB/CapC family capsule biosynthesis tyrosine phosphatase [Clostridium gasigenes]MBB6624663.1 hypothetical protein [Clostridium gasigenes]